jgi:acetylglutamate kinase
MQVIKIGGHELTKEQNLEKLSNSISAMSEPAVIVHGGGGAIAEMQARLGLEAIKVDGLRVTDADTLDVSQMVLSGRVNKTIVAALLSAGVDAAGISGVDGGLLRCVKKEHPHADLGYVGEIVEVRPAILEALITRGLIPVVSPISLGTNGQVYNVNADEAAAALASALEAKMLSFISDVPAVFGHDQEPLSALTLSETEILIRKGVIDGGMVPKVRAALEVIERGVPRARIVNLSGFSNGSGTTFKP